jgi:hypothetical protein
VLPSLQVVGAGQVVGGYTVLPLPHVVGDGQVVGA